jgi:adenylate kinase family enzyme
VPEGDSGATGPATGQRIVIVGTTGSGKTTLAATLSTRLGIPHIELDALHWGSDWIGVPDEIFRERVTAALAAPAWVTDGNYSVVRDLLWSCADTLIWLDYSFFITLSRLWRRTWRRILTQEPIWHNNRETLGSAFFTRESIFLWLFKTYRRHRREYPQQMARPEHAHLRVIRLRHPRQTRAWLANISPVQR